MGLHLEMLKLPLALLFIVVGLAYGTKYSPPSNGPRSTRTRYKSRNVPGNVDLGSIRLPGVAKPLTLRIKVLPAPNPSEPNEPQSSRNTSLEQRNSTRQSRVDWKGQMIAKLNKFSAKYPGYSFVIVWEDSYYNVNAIDFGFTTLRGQGGI